MEDKPLVSVIIPTYNSERYIEKCLQSIKNQTYKNIEIIVVDKFSTDKTVEIADKYDCKIIQSEAEMSKARNIGLKNSNKNSKYVLFVDSDMELTPKVLKECIELMESDGKGIYGIIVPERTVGDSLLAKIRAYERSFYTGTEIEAPRFFRKEEVDKVGGYDEDIIFYEDHTLPQKLENLGFNVNGRIKSLILHHEEHLTLLKHLNKKIYYGITASNYKRRYSKYASKQMSYFHRLFVFLKNKNFYSKPSLALGVIFLKFVEYFSAGIGYIIGRREKR